MCCDCVLDDSKARRELGYAPVMSVDRGLEELAAKSG
jgi:nucleoside-diphosphate-sugar epimerase